MEHTIRLGVSIRVSLSLACLLAALACPGALLAQEPNSCAARREMPGVAAGRDCPAVFGDEDAHQRNDARRQALLERVVAGAHCADVVHSGDWMDPEEISFQELDLVETLLAPGCEPAALVHLGAEDAAIDCRTGLYLVEVGDSIGEEAHLLAIIDNVLLVEHAGRLRFLKTDDSGTPVWRMVWHPAWRFHAPRSTVGAGAAVQPARPRGK